ncbi:MAG: ribosome silencing factor [Clostridia bacterium]|nr:ribosome silencing factor [Clostridia bacterium]
MEELFENWQALPSLADADAAELAETCRAVLDMKKGSNIAVIRVEGRSDITDYLVLCSANSGTHVVALSGELEFRLAQRGVQPLHTDGGNARNWQVVDYGTVMVHIFDREAREFYNLDKLYREPLAAADGAQTEV